MYLFNLLYEMGTSSQTHFGDYFYVTSSGSADIFVPTTYGAAHQLLDTSLYGIV